jgi:undecaprenyl-phosphate galactose phosphotransferase/putative colanic acid biosynthesis UDP-glucose lipid carrier transferase
MSERALRKTHELSQEEFLYFAPAEISILPVDNFGPLRAAVKRLCDIAIAGCALIFLTPLFLLAALAIKLESHGPIIFRQHRIGLNGDPFVIYKFRTMTVTENGTNIAQARRSDPRVTKIGRLLRQSSIDELPQLINVLKGDMSLVGPRPHAIAHDVYYGAVIANYASRRRVRPGITGWAQINGLRGETETVRDMEARVNLDMWYIEHWSLLLDLHIAWRTCFEVIRWQAY